LAGHRSKRLPFVGIKRKQKYRHETTQQEILQTAAYFFLSTTAVNKKDRKQHMKEKETVFQ
jgi:hypothetical protein